MFDLSEEISLGSGLGVGSLSNASWAWSPNSSAGSSGGWASSNELKIVMEEVSTMKHLLHMLVEQSGHSSYVADDSNNEPEAKKVSCCPRLGTITTLCSIFVIMAHDVVLFATRENMLQNHWMMFPTGFGRL